MMHRAISFPPPPAAAMRRAAAFATWLVLFLALVILPGLPARGQALTRYELGEVAFSAPSGWQIAYASRDQEYSLASPDGSLYLMAFWWVADEPLTGWPDQVTARPVTVAGRPATFVHNRNGRTNTMIVAFDAGRQEDGYRFLFNLSSESLDPAGLEAALMAILATVEYGGAAPSPAPEAPVAIPVLPGIAPDPAPDGTGQDQGYYDPASDLGLIQPAGWQVYSADQPGVRQLTLVSPDLKALVVVAKSPGAAEAQRFEDLFFGQFVLPREILGDDPAEIAGYTGSVVGIVAKVYPVGGVQPAFDRARAEVFRGRSAEGGLLIATLRPERDETAAPVLAAVMASVRRGAAPEPGAVPVAPPAAAYAAADRFPLWAPMLAAIAGEDCPPADPGWFAAGPGPVLAQHGPTRAEWAALCPGSGVAMLGVDAPYDMRLNTGDFYLPLLLDLLDANGGKPVLLIETKDLTVAVVSDTGEGPNVVYEDLPDPRAYAAAIGAAPPEPAETPAPPVATAPEPVAPEPAAPPPLGVVFAGQPDANWLPWSERQGSYDEHARFQGGALVIDVPERNGWAGIGIVSAVSMIGAPVDGRRLRVALTIDPARSGNAELAVVPAGADPGKAHYRLSLDLGDPSAPVARLWVAGEKAGEIPLSSPEEARNATLDFFPDGFVRLSVADGAKSVDAAHEGRLNAGYVLYAMAVALAYDAPARAAFERIEIAAFPYEPGPDADRFLYGPEDAVVFDGKGLGRRWIAYQPWGNRFADHARFDGGALVVAVPEGHDTAQIGIAAEAPVVWLDRLEGGGSARVTVETDPARTDSIAVVLSVPRTNQVGNPIPPAIWAHWQREGDAGRLALWSNTDDRQEVETGPDIPDQFALVLREGQVRVRGAGWPDLVLDWPLAAQGQGLRMHVFTLAGTRNQPVALALTRVIVSRSPGAVPDEGPAPGVEPLPFGPVFDGTQSPGWEPVAVGIPADQAEHGFAPGRYTATCAAEYSGFLGLLSADPVASFDHRIDRGVYRMKLSLLSDETDGIRIGFDGSREVLATGGGAASLVMTRAPDGVHAGDWKLQLSSGPWTTWERWIDRRWADENWTGEILFRIGPGWMSVTLLTHEGPGLELRGDAFLSSYGMQWHMAMLTQKPVRTAPCRMAIAGVWAGWETPPGMTVQQRHGLVDDAAFDVDDFLRDAFTGTEQ